ncbi:MAG TPA: hypothetical protein VND64_33970 [Pirellulales bacterium]|nr:hypothetical protein [Pirellulales bacterium]
MSAYTAATAADLIADINAANKAGGANSITLTAPTSSPYVLTAVNNSTDGPTGTPEISGGTRKVPADNLTIVGNGDTIERGTNAPFRLFDVATGGSLTLENLTLANGVAYGAGSAAQGGAVRNQGTLLLSQVTVGGNEALGVFYQSKKSSSSGDAAGGGIWSSGALTVENQSVIHSNTVSGAGNGNAYGGGICSSGALTVENQSVIQLNSVIGAGTGSGYGGGIAIVGGTADIDSTTIGSFPSPAETYGGNSALGGYQNDGIYAPNGPGAGYGGGIYVGAGTVTLTNDVIEGNSAGSYIDMLFEGFDDLGYGGGIYIASVATVYLDTNTLIRGNTGLAPSATTDIYGQVTLLA